MGDFKKGLVAVFVLGGVVLFAIGLFLIGDRKKLFSGSVEIYAEWKDLGGLQNGGIVRVAGMSGGEITNIDLPPSPEQKFKVRFRILKDFLPILRTDSIATIETDGLVGNKLVEISPGTAKAPQLSEGGTLQSKEPFEFADLVKQASEVVENVRKTVDESEDQLQEVLNTAKTVAKKTEQLVTDVTPDAKRIVASSRKVVDHVETIAARLQAGDGTVGKLLKDDQLYNNAKNITEDVRKTTSNVQELVADAKQRDIIKDVKDTTSEVKDMAKRANQALHELQPDKGEGSSIVGDLRQTIAFANETMSDFSENAEALKHNWFFRGFFNRRGFYDLDTISVEDYRAGRKAPGYPVQRVWVKYNELFTRHEDQETLTEAGKRRLAEAMSQLLPSAKSSPLIIEGYALGNNRTEEFVRSQERAQVVREHLLKTFLLRPNYVGIMQMGTVEPKPGAKPWEGVALVLFEPEAPQTKPSGKANGVKPTSADSQ